MCSVVGTSHIVLLLDLHCEFCCSHVRMMVLASDPRFISLILVNSMSESLRYVLELGALGNNFWLGKAFLDVRISRIVAN